MVFAKKLFNSTILGLTLGVLLAGYAVFAFQGPSQGPPAGNVAAPINTGSSDQTKTGGLLQVFGLWVNGALGVTGGATFGGPVRVGQFSAKPTCDANTLGSLVFDTTNNRPYVCAAAGTWKPLDSDFDKDGLVDWLDPNDISFNPECIADNGGQCFTRPTTKSGLDADLAAGNIKSGVNIFGVTGTFGGIAPTAKTCNTINNVGARVSVSALDSACSSYCFPFTGARTCNTSYIFNADYTSFAYSNCSGAQGSALNVAVCELAEGTDERIAGTTTCTCN